MRGARAAGDPDWVTIYDPEAAWNGFTLAFHHSEYPILMDMTGRIVHSWPEARLKTRVRLLPDCSILGVGAGRHVTEYDWHGNQVWQARFEDRIPHHDVIRLTNGNTMVLTLATDSETDDVLELDRAGEVVWEWRSEKPLEPFIESARKRFTGDTTHLNSVDELPDNPWYRAGDERFRPGNLLLSARNLNLVLIVDRATGEVVWTYQEDLDLQHEARMLRSGSGHEGHIMLFNNRYGSFRGDRQSRMIELDPRDGRIVWSYSSPDFFSGTGGAQQALPNGNVLIASGRGPRAFEVDRSGRTVWQWEPPFGVNRPERYATEYCSELEALGRPDGPPVRPPKGYRHVDREAYRFSRRNHRLEAKVAGVKRTLIKPERSCSTVYLPHEASILLSYGVDRPPPTAAPLDGYSARFWLVVGNPESGEETVVFEDTIASEGPDWREQEVGLGDFQYQRREVCVRLAEDGLGDRKRGLAFWGAPNISSARDRRIAEAARAPADPTAEELEVRQEHLRAMGYVN